MGQFLTQIRHESVFLNNYKSKQKWEMLCCSIVKRDPTFQRSTLFSRVKRSLLFSPSVLSSRVKESLLFSPSALSSRVKTVVIFQPRNFVSERNLLKCFSILILDLYTMGKTVKMNRSEDGQTWEQEEMAVTPCSRVKTVPIFESWNFAFWETFAQSHAPSVSGKRWDGRPRRMRGVVLLFLEWQSVWTILFGDLLYEAITSVIYRLHKPSWEIGERSIQADDGMSRNQDLFYEPILLENGYIIRLRVGAHVVGGGEGDQKSFHLMQRLRHSLRKESRNLTWQFQRRKTVERLVLTACLVAYNSPHFLHEWTHKINHQVYPPKTI